MSVELVMQQRRGSREFMPATALSGQLLYCLDTQELFSGTGAGVAKIRDVIVSENAPLHKVDGQIWFDKTEGSFKRWDEPEGKWISETIDGGSF